MDWPRPLVGWEGGRAGSRVQGKQTKESVQESRHHVQESGKREDQE